MTACELRVIDESHDNGEDENQGKKQKVGGEGNR